jgi:quercetin dioxygenase-like cupin family protein
MPFINLSDIEEKEKLPGFKARIIHSDNMTFSFWNIKEGSAFPAHSHINEQITIVNKGSFELTVDGKHYLMKPGTVFVIPSNMPHSGKAMTDSEVIDAFYPVREDFK